jgi:hypothetical protein
MPFPDDVEMIRSLASMGPNTFPAGNPLDRYYYAP